MIEKLNLSRNIEVLESSNVKPSFIFKSLSTTGYVTQKILTDYSNTIASPIRHIINNEIHKT